MCTVPDNSKHFDMDEHSKLFNADYLPQSYHHELSAQQSECLQKLGLLVRPGRKRRGCRAGRHYRLFLSSLSSSSSSPRTLLVASFNAQSVGSKEKRAMISDFISEKNIDIMFITETWLHATGDEGKCVDLTPRGYLMKSFPRGSRGGGIAVIYRDSLDPYLVFSTSFPFDHQSFELLHVKFKFQKMMNFFCLYRPPPSKKNSMTDKMFLEHFPDMLDMCNILGGESLILGDFNFHYDRPNDMYTSKLIELLHMFSMSQLVRQPTHVRGHTLDWVVCRGDCETVKSTSVTDAIQSDHYCVMTRLRMSIPPPATICRSVRNIRGIDRYAFKDDIRRCLLDVHDAQQLNTCLQSVLDHHAPLTKRKVSSRPSSPWYSSVSQELRQAKQSRRQAERQWRKSGLTVHKQIYCTANNLVNTIVFNAKTDYTCDKIANSSSSKELFSITKQLLGKKTSIPLPSIVPIAELPEHFSDYFLKKVQAIRDGLDALPCRTDPHCVDGSFEGQCLSDFEMVGEEEVLKIMKNLAPKHCELDPIPTPLLCECIEELLPTITKVMNDSLLSGNVPTIFKTALVKPLLKKISLDQNDLKNYRPVSNLPFMSKVLEKIVLAQILKHLDTNNLLNPLQSAYRAGHSTETALLKIINDLLHALDEGHVSVLALLDLSSAFDTIDHGILLRRLEYAYGIRGQVLRWLKSYLTDRSQTVSIGGSTSSSAPLLFGVPQGSVLGPLLFIMYMQPLCRVISSSSVCFHSYSDDTQLYKSGRVDEIQDIIESIQQSICAVGDWMLSNKLKLNEEKTEAMLVISPRASLTSPLPQSIMVQNTEIAFSSHVKNLGVTLDCNLSMNSHVANTCKSAYIELRRISSIRHLLTREAANTLVCAFVLSKLDYGNALLCGCPLYLLDRLQKVQNSAARLVAKVKKSDHVTPILRSLHWLPVCSRVQYKLLSICHVCLSPGSSPLYLSNLLHVYTPTRQLRSSADRKILKIPVTRTKTFGERMFSYQAPVLWNNLPTTMRYLPSPASFRQNLKTFLFSKI